MKYKTEKTLRRAKKAFSLIELMIVIVIIGALTAIILPQFDISESEAKDAGCDASNYGTLSQLTKFRSLYGAYPARMHTGLEASSSTEAGSSVMGSSGKSAAIPSFTFYNMSDEDYSVVVDLEDTTTSSNEDGEYDNTGYASSLREAGIVSLAYGGFPTGDAADAPIAFIGTGSGKAKVIAVAGNWFEAWDAGDDGIVSSDEMDTLDEDSTPISINGIPLPYYMYEEPNYAYAEGYDIPTVSNTGVSATAGDGVDADSDGNNGVDATDVSSSIDGIVVPLILAPTTDWEHWYDADGNQNDSKIGVAQVGQCPWLEAGSDFRYYIAIFKLYSSGDKAKLIGTMCPEGGSINP